jgi:hypothetical protein
VPQLALDLVSVGPVNRIPHQIEVNEQPLNLDAREKLLIDLFLGPIGMRRRQHLARDLNRARDVLT